MDNKGAKSQKRRFVEGQFFEGKTIKEIHRTNTDYLLFFIEGGCKIIPIKNI